VFVSNHFGHSGMSLGSFGFSMSNVILRAHEETYHSLSSLPHSTRLSPHRQIDQNVDLNTDGKSMQYVPLALYPVKFSLPKHLTSSFPRSSNR